MGTILEVRLPEATRDASALAEVAFEEVARVEAAASLWRPASELARVHERAAQGEATVLSETLGALVEEALRAADLTRGVYSPAVGALVAAYDFRGEGRWPTGEERRRCASLARANGIHFDPSTRSLRLDAGVILDLDGISKGFALDRAASALRAREVRDALLNFGGQVLAVGPPENEPPREVVVASPEDPATPVISVRIRNASVSTSANTERARLVAGRKAGHLLDPRTGNLVRFAGSTSVLASSGALADALSTAWAVAGPAAFRRSDPGSRLRRAGAVAFALPRPGGGCETLTDLPFERLPARQSVPRDAAAPP